MMLNRIFKLLFMGATACGVLLFDGGKPFSMETPQANALPAIDYSNDLGQVTNVNQLRVAPTDWAYEALRSLVDRYGCISGFPNQTYRGNQPLSRYEFAAGLNSCLNQIERLIASGSVSKDTATIERLTQEFEAELATLEARVDEIESRTAAIEDNSFSTTTKLNGEIVSYVLGTFGNAKPDGSDIDDEITFSNRLNFYLDSSFTGEDLLTILIEASNITSPTESGGTNSLALNLEAYNDTNNSIEISDLYYTFPITERVSALIGANGVDVDDFFDVTPTMGIAYDTLSLFSAYNNLIYDNANGGGAAVGVDFDVLDTVNLAVGYWATNPADSSAGNGLFNGNYAAGANLNIALLDERINLSLAYLRAYQDTGSEYDLAGFVGTDAATDPFEDRANSTNNYGLATSFRLVENLAVGGYAGYTTASTIDDNADADILNWSAYVTYTDLLKEGSTAIVSFGQPPTLIDSEGDAVADDANTPYLLNLEYQYSLNDFIQITPGGYALFNPNGDSDNETIYVGTFRTIFTF